MYCMLGKDGWSEPALVNFGAEYPGGEVHIMKGGEYLLMNRYQGLGNGEQGGIWRLRRIYPDGERAQESGRIPIWGRPEFLIANGMRATSTDDGVIYVTDITGHLSQEEGADKGIIARYALSGKKWMRSEDPTGGINSKESDAHPFIAPDESYMIFNSLRPGGAGKGDLYISYREKDGSWGDAINLEALNTSEADWGATVSPDGKYIFFTRNITGNGDIYWVSSKIIEDLRPGR
ncbi:MAG: PD40 domain-containing protein [Candidatus Krumholzibacteriota bacterium]|nr:PD40 domain-containing protein [Candidatus Krumholzibacteriota bacterium]